MVSAAPSLDARPSTRDSGSPSAYSMTRYAPAPSAWKSWMATTPGCRTLAMARASARNLRAKPGWSSRAGRISLTATVRPSTPSVARHTSPMPPAPMRSSSWYRPASTLAPPKSASLRHCGWLAGTLAAAVARSVFPDDPLRFARLPDRAVHMAAADLHRRRADQVGGVDVVELLPS